VYVAFCQMVFSLMAFLTVAFLQEYRLVDGNNMSFEEAKTEAEFVAGFDPTKVTKEFKFSSSELTWPWLQTIGRKAFWGIKFGNLHFC
jgi:hypothetical protein